MRGDSSERKFWTLLWYKGGSLKLRKAASEPFDWDVHVFINQCQRRRKKNGRTFIFFTFLTLLLNNGSICAETSTHLKSPLKSVLWCQGQHLSKLKANEPQDHWHMVQRHQTQDSPSPQANAEEKNEREASAIQPVSQPGKVWRLGEYLLLWLNAAGTQVSMWGFYIC